MVGWVLAWLTRTARAQTAFQHSAGIPGAVTTRIVGTARAAVAVTALVSVVALGLLVTLGWLQTPGGLLLGVQLRECRAAVSEAWRGVALILRAWATRVCVLCGKLLQFIRRVSSLRAGGGAYRIRGS